jgi:hypothetical protein
MVLFLGILMVLWNKDILMKIDNSMGHFVGFEDAWFDNEDRRIAKILVELDLQEGLLDEMEIV